MPLSMAGLRHHHDHRICEQLTVSSATLLPHKQCVRPHACACCCTSAAMKVCRASPRHPVHGAKQAAGPADICHVAGWSIKRSKCRVRRPRVVPADGRDFLHCAAAGRQHQPAADCCHSAPAVDYRSATALDLIETCGRSAGAVFNSLACK